MNIIAIVQARLGSTRLPRKVLADLAGRPLIHHVFERVSASSKVTGSILATTDAPEDDELSNWALENQLLVFRGSQEDVLERFYYAALASNADIIVRITADDAFKDPQVIDSVVSALLSNSAEYASNTIEPSFPEGVDVEVFRFDALERAHKTASRLFEREHVTPYIWQNPELFKLESVVNARDLSHMRWTIDTQADLDFARAVYYKLYQPGKVFLLEDIITLLESSPEISKLMPKIPRNQGLTKSMEGEQ
ncbi:MAG: glycosyltransferase family protein [Bdellovibrionales bacterium]|nr:glycosyltransferase family protein [Bdellovibrionales bacterium]